jgi:ABC-2 type transport system ATP-binding protein
MHTNEPRFLIEARCVSRRFGRTVALDDVSLAVAAGEVHALLGPNGAGKTTLLRILTGIVEPTSGSASVMGLDPSKSSRFLRRQIGLVPSGDRSFYLRLSGLENLVFFARLHGFRRRAAIARAREVLEEVDLAHAERVPVGVYSHGMQKRLSVARAFLTDPTLLFIDEATHDLDPEGARTVQDLARRAARRGAAVVWTTQRIDEIRGFADRITLLSKGNVRFVGTVPELMSHSAPRRYLLRLRNGRSSGDELLPTLRAALDHMGAVAATDVPSSEHFVVSLADEIVLGDALASLTEAGVHVLACREERSEIEEAFLFLTRESES